ncbi:MAG: DUF3108 domain-containing protein, partial [Polaromonas sp.]|nr:DUF3108 domain-containing protein [Polaromonas sp.]
MSSWPAPQTPRPGPRWRALGLLLAAVLAAHALMLQTAPLGLGPAQAPEAQHATAFVTRRIEAPPATEPPAPEPKPAATIAKPPVFKKKKA